MTRRTPCGQADGWYVVKEDAKASARRSMDPRRTAAKVRPAAAPAWATAKSLLESLPAAAIVVDAKGDITAANGRAGFLLARDADELIGRAADGAFRIFLDRAGRMLSQGFEASFEQYFGGTWYAVQAFPIQGSDKDGSPLLVVTASDVTAAKTNEFQIRESEAQLEEATRIAQLGTYKMLWDSNSVEWSPHMYVIHGVTTAFKPSLDNYIDLAHPNDRDALKRIIDDLLAGEALAGVEYRIMRADRSVRWLRIDGRVLFDADGEPYASFGTCQDISEAKQREQDLKDLLLRNAILYEALEASPIGVAVLTVETERPSFFYLNAEFKVLTGHSNFSLSQLGLEALRPDGSDDPVWADALQAFAKSKSGSFELTCARNDGSTFLAQLQLAPVRDHPGHDATAFVVNLDDITIDRRRSEALLQSQKMEALGQLSGGVAHEINNLLQPVLALSDLGIEAADKNPEKVRKYFEVISSSGRKARDVVRQVLTFARRDTPQLAPHVMADLLSDALHLVQSGLPPGITLRPRIATSEAKAVVNPTQMSQVILNLVKNAADAMNGDGTIDVALNVAVLSADAAASLTLTPGLWIELKVTDHGSGMDPQTLSRIFEPFFTTKAAGKGTGLGLAVVYSIVAGWGGTIRMESEVDKGTTAVVYIPSAQSHGQRAPATE